MPAPAASGGTGPVVPGPDLLYPIAKDRFCQRLTLLEAQLAKRELEFGNAGRRHAELVKPEAGKQWQSVRIACQRFRTFRPICPHRGPP